MPKWGLTTEQRLASPWGLNPELLKPSKTITEPVHKDIYLNKLERMFLDSPPMQRLRRVRQLGNTERIFPGATHSRLAHSLGTLRAAQDLLDAVLDQRNGPYPKPDLFAEWADEDLSTVDRRIADATVLARLGGLLHDLCHVPYGHSVEDDLRLLRPHDGNADRFKALWASFGRDLLDQVPGPLQDALRILILSKEHSQSENLRALGPYAFVADIVGNTICADLLDYLARDHLYTGLPAKFGHRFLDGFYVTPASARYNPRRMVIKIHRGDRVRADVITELFKFLRYRYELSERALVQHAKLAADAMVGKALEIWFDDLTDAVASSLDPTLVGHDDISERLAHLTEEKRGSVRVQAMAQFEREMTRRSDDGLLEYLRDRAEADPGNRRLSAAGALVEGLLDRRLFKPIARSDPNYLPMAGQLFQRYEKPDARRRLEADCARYAGLKHRWHVLLWIPAPEMKMKAAGVLVDDDQRILPLDATASGRRGLEIYESHAALWAVSVFVHEDAVSERQVIRAWLARELGIGWASDDAAHALSPLVRLAVHRVARRRRLTQEQEEELLSESAASGGQSTFEALLAATDEIAAVRFGEDVKPRHTSRRPRPRQQGLDLD